MTFDMQYEFWKIIWQDQNACTTTGNRSHVQPASSNLLEQTSATLLSEDIIKQRALLSTRVT